MSNTIKISESKIQKHLSCYRASNSIFEVDEKHSGWVLKNETDNLLKTSYYENLLEFYKDIEERGLIHTWFRSLKSSQAMAINFFGALAREEETFIKVLQNVGSTIPSYTETIPRFEYIEEDSVLGGNPKKFDKTNFDFVLKSKDCNYYFEFKYTEKEFGKHKKEDILEHDNKENLPSKDNYQYKFNNLYKELLEKIGVKIDTFDDFYKDYQIWRNITYTQYGEVFFVFPSYRSDLTDEINNCLAKMNNLTFRNRVHILPTDIVAEQLMNEKNNQKLSEHFSLFWEKYFGFIK